MVLGHAVCMDMAFILQRFYTWLFQKTTENEPFYVCRGIYVYNKQLGCEFLSCIFTLCRREDKT
jgi:hypothetical protein